MKHVSIVLLLVLFATACNDPTLTAPPATTAAAAVAVPVTTQPPATTTTTTRRPTTTTTAAPAATISDPDMVRLLALDAGFEYLFYGLSDATIDELMEAACDLASTSADFFAYLDLVDLAGWDAGFTADESDEVGMDAVIVYCPEFQVLWGLS